MKMFEWIIYSGLLECCLLVILLLGIATDPYSTGEIILWGLTALLAIWVLSAVYHLAWWLYQNPQNPFFLVLLLLIWMHWSNPKATSSTTSVPQQASSVATRHPIQPSKKKAKKKEDPGPPSPVRRKGKLPSVSSVLKRNSELP